jgi:uncharacterized repeat protein (TIGR02543 family)
MFALNSAAKTTGVLRKAKKLWAASLALALAGVGLSALPASAATINNVKFAASVSTTYDHTVGGGAWNDGSITWAKGELQGTDFKCGEWTTYLLELNVNPAAGAGPHTAAITVTYTRDTTGGSGVSLNPSTAASHLRINSGPIYGADHTTPIGSRSGSLDGGANADGDLAVMNNSGATLTDNGKAEFTSGATQSVNFTVSNLKPGANVIVRSDAQIHCKAGSRPTGNLQAVLTSVAITAPTAESVSAGNQTVNFKNADGVAGASSPLLSVVKSVSADGTTCTSTVPTADVRVGSPVLYCYTVYNYGSVTAAGVTLVDDNATSATNDDVHVPLKVGTAAATTAGVTIVGGGAYATGSYSATYSAAGTYTNTASAVSTTSGATLAVTAKATVTAISGLSVTYDGQSQTSGSVPTDVTPYNSGSNVTVAQNPGNLVKTGYTFGGWSTTAGGTSPVASLSNLTSSTTLYAIWTPVAPPTATPDATSGAAGAAQSINLLGNDSASTGVSLVASSARLCSSGQTAPNCTATTVTVAGVGTYSVSNGTVTFVPALGYVGTPAALAYQVSDSAGNTASSTYTPTVNAATGPFSISYDGQGATGGTVPSDATQYNSGDTVTVRGNDGNLVKPGYLFGGWATAPGSSTPVSSISNLNSPATLFAIWTPVPAPVASPDTTTGPVGAAQTKNLLANDTADSRTSLDTSSVRLCDPTTNEIAPNCTASSVTAAGVGTYAVTPAGVITFTPLSTFTGTPADLAYQVADGVGNVASSTYTPTVIPAPTATPDTTTGVAGATQSINLLTNDTASTGASLVPSSVKLCDPAGPQASPNCTATSVTVANVGTYSVANGVVSFTPVSGYTGTATPLGYQVSDSVGNVASSTYTPTVTAAAPPAPAPAPTYSVNYNPQGATGGTAPNDPTAYAAGASPTVAGNPGSLVKPGFIFGGWATTPGGTTPVTSLSNLTANTNLYAIWTPVPPTYKVTYDPQAATGGVTPIDPNDYASGSNVTLAKNPGALVKPGYIFGGWATTPTGTTPVASLSNLTADAKVYAIWTPGPAATPEATTGVAGATQTSNLLANDTPTAGATWVASSVKFCTAGQVAPNCTATSVTVPNVGTYTVANGVVSFTPVYGFIGTAAPLTYQVTDSAGNTASSTYTPTVTEVVNPPAPTYSLTYDPQGATTGKAPVDPNGYAPGSNVNLAGNPGALVKPGFSFGGWTTTPGGTTPVTSLSNLKSNATLYPVWNALPPTYSVTYDSQAATEGSVPVDTTAYPSGSNVNLANNPGVLVKTGFTFGGWAATPGGTSPITSLSNLKANATLYAIWTPAPAVVEPQTFTFASAEPDKKTTFAPLTDIASADLPLLPDTLVLCPNGHCGAKFFAAKQGKWTLFKSGTVTFIPAPGWYGKMSMHYEVQAANGTTVRSKMVVFIPKPGQELPFTGDVKSAFPIYIQVLLLLGGLSLVLSTRRRANQ